MPGINPDIMRWARETAGLDIEQAAKKIGLKAARGVSGPERLQVFESGAAEPSSKLLGKMAEQYHRPLLTFYMPARPKPDDIGQDFRTLPERSDPANALLDSLLRDVKARQSLAREQIEDDEDAELAPLVGAARGIASAQGVAEAVIQAIGFERTHFRAQKSYTAAFDYLRGCAERAGIFVLLLGDLGSWQTAIDVTVFRGFAIADEFAPFIVINDQDAKSAWSFTLLHELAHVALGASGVSGYSASDATEKLCNDAAAAVLTTPAEIAAIEIDGTDADIDAIGRMAARCKISRSMAAYQLFRARRISEERWEELRQFFYGEWRKRRALTKAANRESDNGPSWYVIRRHRLGNALLAIARHGIVDGTLTPTRAARMLGVKPMAVYPLLFDSPKRTKAA